MARLSEHEIVERLTRQATEEKGILIPSEFGLTMILELRTILEGIEVAERAEVREDEMHRIVLTVWRGSMGISTKIGKRRPWPNPPICPDFFPSAELLQRTAFKKILPLIQASRNTKSRLAQAYYDGGLAGLVREIEKRLSGLPRIAAHVLMLVGLIPPSEVGSLELEYTFKEHFELYRQCRVFHGLTNIFGNSDLVAGIKL